MVVSSDRNVVNESNKVIVENKDMKCRTNQAKDARKFFTNKLCKPKWSDKNYKKRKRIHNLVYSNEISGHNELVQIRKVTKSNIVRLMIEEETKM